MNLGKTELTRLEKSTVLHKIKTKKLSSKMSEIEEI